MKPDQEICQEEDVGGGEAEVEVDLEALPGEQVGLEHIQEILHQQDQQHQQQQHHNPRQHLLVFPTDSEFEEMFNDDYESNDDDSDLEELIGNNVREEENDNKYNDNAADDNLEFYLQDIRNERRFRNICFHCPSLRLKVPVRNVSPVWRVSWDQGTPREG